MCNWYSLVSYVHSLQSGEPIYSSNGSAWIFGSNSTHPTTKISGRNFEYNICLPK